MKKLLLSLTIFFIAAAGFASGPFMTMNAIRTAVAQQDKAALAESVDFPTLRENLREQLKASMNSALNEEARRNPFAALAASLAGKMMEGLADNMVDQIVTPDGISELLDGQQHWKNLKESQRARNTAGDNDEAAIASQQAAEPGGKPPAASTSTRWNFDNLSMFSLYVVNRHGEQTRFVLTRQGLHWRLSNIVLPPLQN